MGTSGAYGGSPAGDGVRDQTREWLDSGGGGGEGGGDSSDAPPSYPPEQQPRDPEGRPPGASPTISSALTGVISGLGNLLAGRGGRGGSAGGSSGGRGRSASRASAAGGRALGGVYGVRTGTAGTLAELGLDLAELSGLTRYEQAKRILDAAIGPKGDVLDSELRKTNAAVVLWALLEDVEPTPLELANRWVVEYVWEVWITESGPTLQDYASDRLRAEQEMRAALEATIEAHALPRDRPVTIADFTSAIEGALSSLRRISGSAA